MAELKVNISYSKEMQNKIDKYIDKLEMARSNAMKEISTRVQDKLLENMIKYDVDSSKILNSVVVIEHKDSLEISVGCEYAIFVEFGTGIIGSENPHPNPKKANWVYGNNGWWYPTTPEVQTRYPNQPTTYINGNLYAFTKGQKSKPFLYDTWLFATRIATKTLKKHIRGVKLD